MRHEAIDWTLYHPAGPDGMCKFDRMVTYHELHEAMKKRLKELPGNEPDSSNLYNELDYFDFAGKYEKKSSDGIPVETRWIACFAVEGGSEGHYIHVEIIHEDEHRRQVRELAFLGKTFMGLDHALRVSNELTKIVY